ncbi:MAG: tyrosyl-tRNA synthetase [Solirubrobacteraceae bacterium]|nr:tyrosyl-tRNA synthetase [Solirubrobacteraceae bacterium]
MRSAAAGAGRAPRFTTLPGVKPSTSDVLDSFARTTDSVVTLDRLRELLDSGRRLKIKYGVDATAPFLHIGHAVNLWMMRELQEQGHVVQFLIGDVTTRIGDPTGRSQTRPQISGDDIETNAQAFIDQVGAVLRTDPEVFEIRRNSEWYDPMSAGELMGLVSQVTLAHLQSRDMFRRRIERGEDIRVHELLYPVLQGYDSLMLGSDLTIVGTDQLFNEMMGRFFQERGGQSPQVVLTTKITPGTDGKEKQSKSLGNFIALNDTARDVFGKVMSIPDTLIVPYLEIYTKVPDERIAELRGALERGALNPRDAKLELAQALVARYHGEGTAEDERRWFQETFSKRRTPQDAATLVVPERLSVLELLRAALPDESASAARRLVEQRAVKLDGEPLTDPHAEVEARPGAVLQVGKRRWFRLANAAG